MAIANYMLEFTDLDELRLVLSPRNPLKSDRGLTSPEERLRTMERAIVQSGLPISVSTVEFSLPEPYYTINTLRYLAAREPHVCFVLIIGADNLTVIEQWHKWRELLHEFEVYVYPRSESGRGGHDTKTLCEVYGVKYIDAPLIEVSSTFIRKGWAEGKNMNGFLAGI